MAATNGLIERAKASPRNTPSPTPTAVRSPGKHGRALHLAHKLQTTLDVESLIELFRDESGKDVPHDGLVYRNPELDLELSSARTAAAQVPVPPTDRRTYSG